MVPFFCSIGGELRLCLPQILRQTLSGFHWQQICKACEELQIHCAPCSAGQLLALRSAGFLPLAAHQCGLITKSDAERLTSYLMLRYNDNNRKNLGNLKLTSPLQQQHEQSFPVACDEPQLPGRGDEVPEQQQQQQRQQLR